MCTQTSHYVCFAMFQQFLWGVVVVWLGFASGSWSSHFDKFHKQNSAFTMFCLYIDPHKMRLIYQSSFFRHSSAWEVCVHGDNVMVKSRMLGISSAGQFELLCSMGELKSSIWMGRVWQQSALSFQEIGHDLQKLPETKSQGSFPQTVQLLTNEQKCMNENS